VLESFSLLGTWKVLRAGLSKVFGGVLLFDFFGFLASRPWGLFTPQS